MQAANALLTDLYQLNMLQAYLERRRDRHRGVRVLRAQAAGAARLPGRRRARAGARLSRKPALLARRTRLARHERPVRATASSTICAAFRFTGDVHAMPEGTVFFADEPILRITAPLPQAQLVETRLINLLHFQSLIAAKAARMVLAAPGKLLVDFGLRRAHGAEAGLLAARASYIAASPAPPRCSPSKQFGIPIFGTMAHSFVQAHDDEIAAFEHFARARPREPDAADRHLRHRGGGPQGGRAGAAARKRQASQSARVRIDSGDLVALSQAACGAILDDGGLARRDDLRQRRPRRGQACANCCAAGAPIDGFGIGTQPRPPRPTRRRSTAPTSCRNMPGCRGASAPTGKATWPGRKQVWRRYGADGRMTGDMLSLEDDRQAGEPLIQPVMQCRAPAGAVADAWPTSARRAAHDLERLPEALRRLDARHILSGGGERRAGAPRLARSTVASRQPERRRDDDENRDRRERRLAGRRRPERLLSGRHAGGAARRRGGADRQPRSPSAFSTWC